MRSDLYSLWFKRYGEGWGAVGVPSTDRAALDEEGERLVLKEGCEKYRVVRSGTMPWD